MQKQRTSSHKNRRRVESTRGSRSQVRATAPRWDVEQVVRTARPVQLEEADWVLDESTTWPVDEEAHPRHASARVGTLSRDPEGHWLPVVEPGLSIDPEDLGRQFLRDATEQDNFESAVDAAGSDPGASALEQVISEASLEASAQAGFAVPESSALGGSGGRERALEPRTGVFDAISSVVREASLFDQPTEDGDTRVPLILAEEQTRANRGKPNERG
jgi:hypothetical protein